MSACSSPRLLRPLPPTSTSARAMQSMNALSVQIQLSCPVARYRPNHQAHGVFLTHSQNLYFTLFTTLSDAQEFQWAPQATFWMSNTKCPYITAISGGLAQTQVTNKQNRQLLMGYLRSRPRCLASGPPSSATGRPRRIPRDMRQLP